MNGFVFEKIDHFFSPLDGDSAYHGLAFRDGASVSGGQFRSLLITTILISMQARFDMKLSLRSEEEGILRLQNEGEIRLGDQLRERSSVEDVLGADCYSRKILLDLSNTSYLDSAGVGWLVKFHKLCQQFGGVLVLHSLPPAIMAILRLLHMERFLHIVDDERAARALARGEAP
jgi:anti-anti-sigma factor